MPYEWRSVSDTETQLQLWPYRSLPRRGMVWFIAATSLLIALPLVALIGTMALWGLLPFLLATIGGIWWALNRSFRDAEILENLSLSPGQVTLTRHANGKVQSWEANPHWVRPVLHPKSGPVPNYLTLQGGPREVELGAFLSSDERLHLLSELKARFAALR